MRWASVRSPAQRLALARLARDAALARPGSPALQRVWAEAVEAAGEPEEALELFASACRRFPDDVPLHSGYAEALTRSGKLDRALDHVRPWLPSPWARKIHFRLLVRAGFPEEAALHEESLAEADPADADLLEFRAERLRDSPEALLRACDEALSSNPAATHFLYHKALALTLLGRSEEAAALMDPERFLRILDLGAPPPFEEAEAFNRGLGAEIEANPTLHRDPAGHATREGRRTLVFPLPGDSAGAALVAAVSRAVSDYADGLAGSHPFVAARPTHATLKSWALLFDSRGHQRLHHHPGPWLTGVYYVTAPSGPVRPGALRIGSVPHWLGRRPPWPVLDIEPEPGRLVLFPSFVPHETLPTGSDEVRISVAFDVASADR
jgi:hypothetical protein